MDHKTKPLVLMGVSMYWFQKFEIKAKGAQNKRSGFTGIYSMTFYTKRTFLRVQTTHTLHCILKTRSGYISIRVRLVKSTHIWIKP